MYIYVYRVKNHIDFDYNLRGQLHTYYDNLTKLINICERPLPLHKFDNISQAIAKVDRD